MTEVEFIVTQESCLRNRIKEDYKINHDIPIYVEVKYITDNPPFNFVGIAKFRDYELVVYGYTRAEAMVNLCVEYGSFEAYGR